MAFWIVMNVETFDPSMPLKAGGPAFDTMGLGERLYGNNEAIVRVADTIARFGVPVTAATNAAIVDDAPRVAEMMAARRWEIMGHGMYNNRPLRSYDAAALPELIGQCLEKLSTIDGVRPHGWLSPGLHEPPGTLVALHNHGIHYVADWMVHDRPTLLRVGPSPAMVSMPYTVEANDKPCYDRKLLSSDEFADLVIRQFSRLYDESEQRPSVMTLALHPYLSGIAHRIGALEKILKYVTAREDVWFAYGSQIAASVVGPQRS
jgi:peptidoglycan/xylan/chitin deacetylase (PgdA/CDA1 family)